MHERLKLTTTKEDINKSIRFKVCNPILYALQRTTGTLWRMYDDGLLVEVMEPFRAYQLPLEALKQYEAFEAGADITPFECELEPHASAPALSASTAPGVSSLSYQRPCPRRLREAARADGGW